MKIIDFAKKGNTIRFFLSDRDRKDDAQNDNCYNEWEKKRNWYDAWGDDWNDAPYEDNAGQVYGRFVEETQDISFSYNVYVMEPSQAYRGCWSKEEMKERKVPCIIIATDEICDRAEIREWERDDFSVYLEKEIPGVIKIYFGDDIDEVEKKLDKLEKNELYFRYCKMLRCKY